MNKNNEIKVGNKYSIETLPNMHKTIFDGYEDGTVVTVMQIDNNDKTVLVRPENSHLTMWHDIGDLKEIVL